MRVAISGALGRMGRLTFEALKVTPGLEYAGGFARRKVPDLNVTDDLDEFFARTDADVVVDFTVRPVTQRVAAAAIEAGVSPVIGSSEWNDQERAQLAQLAQFRGVGALLVPNFAIGAVLMMRFAEQAARFFPTIEIVEMHRAEKRDKPSGTAAATSRRIRESGGHAAVPIHSVRLRGLLSHQEVLCGSDGELLTIRHDSFSYESFQPGILLAIRAVRAMSGLQVGLDGVLDAQRDVRA